MFIYVSLGRRETSQKTLFPMMSSFDNRNHGLRGAGPIPFHELDRLDPTGDLGLLGSSLLGGYRGPQTPEETRRCLTGFLYRARFVGSVIIDSAQPSIELFHATVQRVRVRP